MGETAILALAGAAALIGAYIRSEYEKSHFSAETYRISLKNYHGEEKTLVFLSIFTAIVSEKEIGNFWMPSTRYIPMQCWWVET